MIDSPDLQSLARELGVRIVGPLTGGEFGAMLAVDGAGREFVLKVMSPPAVLTLDRLATLFRRGAVLAGRARAIGYPAPEYLGTGKTDSFAWSLQERLPGTVPDAMTPAHARRLVELAAMHRDIAGESYDWRRFAVDRMREHLQTVVQDQRAVPLAHELAAVMERSEGVEIRQHDVVHADFHHRNYLAIDDEVTGVFDWEFAMPGDWRTDLVNLAFWAALLPGQILHDAASIIIDEAFTACPPDLLAFLVAYQSLRHLDFDVRVHPERVEFIAHGIETQIAPWWRRSI